jgi:N-methylhydantoinase A/oxoprolinase/acetone carboxylase beta subunit
VKRVGVDVGGTFTDLIYVDDEAGTIRVHKLPTTPEDPSQGTVQGIRELAHEAGATRRSSTRCSTARRSRPTSSSSTTAPRSG